jgi:hypothetical protein
LQFELVVVSNCAVRIEKKYHPGGGIFLFRKRRAAEIMRAIRAGAIVYNIPLFS